MTKKFTPQEKSYFTPDQKTNSIINDNFKIGDLLHHGRYKIIQDLGEGISSEVKLAQDLDTHDRVVAIKIVDLNNDSLDHQKFLKESDRLVNLKHKGLPFIIEQWQDDDNYFIVMDYAGITLSTYCEKLKEEAYIYFKKNCLKSIYLQILDVMQYVHEHDVAHLDLKPDNILIDEETLNIKVIDFGLARKMKNQDNNMSYFLAPVANHNYASPESRKSMGASRLSDIYSLGGILYYLSHSFEEPPSIPTKEKFHYYRSIIYKCMQEAPQLRYKNIASLRKDFLKINIYFYGIGFTLFLFCVLFYFFIQNNTKVFMSDNSDVIQAKVVKIEKKEAPISKLEIESIALKKFKQKNDAIQEKIFKLQLEESNRKLSELQRIKENSNKQYIERKKRELENKKQQKLQDDLISENIRLELEKQKTLKKQKIQELKEVENQRKLELAKKEILRQEKLKLQAEKEAKIKREDEVRKQQELQKKRQLEKQELSLKSILNIKISENHAEIIGKKIWTNESNQRINGLIVWNNLENHASIGLAHFIWYAKGYEGVFFEDMPHFINLLVKERVNIPNWMLTSRDCPWANRGELLLAKKSKSRKYNELLNLLLTTKKLQMQYVINVMINSMPKILNSIKNKTQQKFVLNQFKRLYLEDATTINPKGIFILLDYINFKGTGLKLTERYHGYGWGLKQVLENMSGNSDDAIAEFVKSAIFVLGRRIDNSPPIRNEKRWRQGFNNRVKRYLK